MIRMYHAPITVDGHTFLVDIPFLPTRDAYAAWRKEFEEWARKEIKEVEKH